MVHSLLRVLLIVVMIATPSALLAAPAAAGPCVGTWTIGIGGLGNNDSSSFPTVHQRVGYDSANARSGEDELNRLVRQHRAWCGRDHIKIIGHSQGAGLAHAWAAANPGFPNTNLILLADPKRAPGPGAGGMSQLLGFMGYPMAGVDNHFGGIPTLTICNRTDGVCSLDGGPFVFNPAHSAYDFDVRNYVNWGNGVVFI